MKTPYAAWDSPEHVRQFDEFTLIPSFALRLIFEDYHETRLLRESAATLSSDFSLLEIGCATGEFFRYASSRYPKFKYTGVDISRPAIERAKSKFKERADFRLIQADNAAVGDMTAEIVFARDVVLHQLHPFDFIKSMYELCSRFVIVRMRTRDVGLSVLDPEASCQLVYGEWVPWFVLNCEEVIAEITEYEPRPSRIKLIKDYVILGGANGRFLPKSCYEEATGTAVTGLLVEKGNGEGPECVVEQHVRKEAVTHSAFRKLARDIFHLI